MGERDSGESDEEADDEEAQTQRLVAELAEVRTRMARRASTAGLRRESTASPPKPALAKHTTDRVVVEDDSPTRRVRSTLPPRMPEK